MHIAPLGRKTIFDLKMVRIVSISPHLHSYFSFSKNSVEAEKQPRVWPKWPFYAGNHLVRARLIVSPGSLLTCELYQEKNIMKYIYIFFLHSIASLLTTW